MSGVPIDLSFAGDHPESFTDPADGPVDVVEVARRWGDERLRVVGAAPAVYGVYDLVRTSDGGWTRLHRWVRPLDRGDQLSLL